MQVIAFAGSSTKPSDKFVPFYPEEGKMPDSVKCIDMNHEPPKKDLPNVPGVYVFFHDKRIASYIGQSENNIWGRIKKGWMEGYLSSKLYSHVCYVVVKTDVPKMHNRLSFAPVIVENIMLNMFCFMGNDARYSGDGLDFPPDSVTKAIYIPGIKVNWKCNRGKKDVLSELAIYATDSDTIPEYLYSRALTLRSVT